MVILIMSLFVGKDTPGGTIMLGLAELLFEAVIVSLLIGVVYGGV